MQRKNVLKGLFLALPMMALTACSSTSSSSNSGETSNTGNTEVTSPVVKPLIPSVPVLTEQEMKNKQLRQAQTVYFQFDNAVIQPDYKEMLMAHAEYLRQHPEMPVVIEGHADERGTPEYNIALGERRANAIARYLQAMGVPVSQMTIVSYGEEKPLVFGHSEGDYSKNRRVVLVY